MNGRANAGKGSIAQNAGKERRERQRPQRVSSKLWHHNSIKGVLKLAIEPHFSPWDHLQLFWSLCGRVGAHRSSNMVVRYITRPTSLAGDLTKPLINAHRSASLQRRTLVPTESAGPLAGTMIHTEMHGSVQLDDWTLHGIAVLCLTTTSMLNKH